MKLEIRNSRENYFYWKGVWKDDFKMIILMFIANNLDSSSKTWSKGCKLIFRGWKRTILSIFWFALFICIWLAALVLIPALTLVLSLITGICLIYSNLVAYELSIVENIYLWLHKMQLLCPVCHRAPQRRVPAYICPGCGAVHDDLVPSARYGAFYQVCSNCKTHLPTSRFFGRHKLTAICSYEECRAPFDANIESTALQTVAFVGAPSVGKTCLLTALVNDSVSDKLPARGWNLSYPTDDDKRWIERLVSNLSTGSVPASTKGDVRALCIDAQKKKGTIQRVYYYDPPGEVFDDSDQVSNQLYYSHLKVAIFVIDPFSIPALADEMQSRGIRVDARSGSVSPEDSLNHWLISIERDFGRMMKRVSCAVVINKTDVPELNEICGIEPNADPEVCRNFLTQYGMGHMLSTLEETFSKHALFAVAAHPADSTPGTATKPQAIEELSSWVLKQLNLN